jgi:hypothetical protein
VESFQRRSVHAARGRSRRSHCWPECGASRRHRQHLTRRPSLRGLTTACDNPFVHLRQAGNEGSITGFAELPPFLAKWESPEAKASSFRQAGTILERGRLGSIPRRRSTRECGEAISMALGRASTRVCLCASSAQTRRRPCARWQGPCPCVCSCLQRERSEAPNDKTYAMRASAGMNLP